jgi:hypothetical protein
MLSVVEWKHLTDNQKELHHTMRESWLVHLSSTSSSLVASRSVSVSRMTPWLLLDSVNDSVSQLSHVQPMTVQDVYTLVTLMGLYLSEASGHQKAYKVLLAHIDNSHALTFDKVQHEIIRFCHSHDPRAFTITHVGDSLVCNHSCPRCCDTRGETPRPSRSSSSPRSHSSSRAGSPRLTFSATAAPINTYWRHQGLVPQYHTFTVILQSNYVRPHQVILDTNINHFGLPDDGHALIIIAANYPEEPPSDNNSA